LGKYEVIIPNSAPVTEFKNTPVFSRTSVGSIHTKERWIQEGMQVKNKEKPFKLMKKRKRKRKNVLQDEEDEQSQYFGSWQVEPYDPGEAKDGIVPKNEYGNVYLYNENMLPRKCSLLKLQNLPRIAKKMKIDCAKAISGWVLFINIEHRLILI